MSEAQPGAPRRMRKGCGIAVVVCAVLAAAVGIVWATGWPQRVLLRLALERVTGARVTVAEAGIGRGLHARGLAFHDFENQPRLKVDTVDLELRMWPADGRYVPSVDVRGLSFIWNGREPQGGVFGGLLDGGDTAPPGPNPMRFVPRDIRLRDMRLGVEQADAGLSLDGLECTAAIQSWDNLTVELSAGAARASWWLRTREQEHEEPAGSFDLAVQRTGADVFLNGVANVPDLVELAAAGSVHLPPGEMTIGAQIDRLHLASGMQALLPMRDLPVPIRFERIDLSGSRIEVRVSGENVTLPNVNLNAEAQGLEIGEPDAPWYRGDVSVEGHGTLSEDSAVQTGIVLNNGPVLFVTARGSLWTARVEAVVEDWTRADLEAAIPEAYRGWLAYSPRFSSVAGRALFNWARPRFNWDIRLRPKFGDMIGEFAAVGDMASSGDAERALSLTASAALASGRMSLRAAFSPDDLETASVTLENVSVGDCAAALAPGILPESLGVKISGDVAWVTEERGSHITGRGTLNDLRYGAIAFPSDKPLSFDGDVLLDGNTGALLNAEGHLRAEDAAELTVRNIATAPFHVETALVLKQFPLDTWLGADSGVRGVLDGTAQFSIAESAYQAMLDLGASDLGLGAWSASVPVHVEGGITAQGDAQEARGAKLTLTAGEGTSLAVHDWVVRWPGLSAEGRLAGRVDTALLNNADLWGSVDIKAPFKVSGGRIQTELALSTNELGYGDWAVPYGQTLSLASRLSLAADTGAFTLEHISGQLDASNQFHAEKIEGFVSGECQVSAFEVDTDLTPLVAMEYLAAASGHAKVTGALSTAPWRLETRAELAAAHLALPGQLAELEDLSFTADVKYDGASSGSGVFKAGGVTVSGIKLAACETNLRIEEGWLRSAPFETRVFDGGLGLAIECGLFAPGLPIRVTATAKDADLAVFTAEFKPPSVTLTGRASGEVMVEWGGGTLRDIRVDLESREGFSLNRDMVEQLVLSQYTNDLPMGKKVQRVLADILGKESQRPFDMARLKLGFEGGRIVGNALLESRDLQLDVDVRVDPGAVVEIMRARSGT